MSLQPENIRNLLITGHSGCGKTQLAEAMLYFTKGTDRLGNSADGNTICDFDPEEIKRKVSVSLAIAPVDYKNCRINLLDAPGLFDFELGYYEGIMAAETVLISVSARDGVAVGAQKAVKLADKHKKAKMIYVGRMDVENASFDKTFAAIKTDLAKNACPVVVPVLEEGKPTVYNDLIHKKAYTYKNGVASECAFDEGRFSEYIAMIREAVAETDEALLEKFLMEEEFTSQEILDGLTAGTADGSIVPVVAGSSVTLEGIDLLLNAITSFAPSPKTAKYKALKGDAAIDVACDPNGPLYALIFKTVADPFVGKLSYVKVVSGKLTAQPFTNSRTGETERPGKLLSVKGKKQTDITELTAGDIGAVTKLPDAKTGDTLCLSGSVASVETVAFPRPSLTMALRSVNKGDEGKIGPAISRIIEEDPTLKYSVNGETSQQIIAGLGEQHLDVTLSKIKSKFGVELELFTPRIAYRETITSTAEAEGKHKKQTGGSGQFGVVNMRFEPLHNGEEFEFVNAVTQGAVPKEYIPAVEKGTREAMKHGVLAGYPMFGVRATLYFGKYHPVDSKEVAFKSAARLAYKEACANAKPAILEPIGLLKAYVPDSNMGDIVGEVNKRRGRVLGMSPDADGLQLIEAEVPMGEMLDFTTIVRSVTQGRGHFDFDFVRYEQLPPQLVPKVIDEAKDLREAEEE